jgi:hypothetical protein
LNVYGFTVSDYLDQLRKEGVSVTETISMFSSLVPMFIVVFALFMHYKDNADEMTRLFRSIEAVRGILSEAGSH